MNPEETAKQLVETRRAEASLLFTAAQTYNARNDQLVAVGVTVIGAVLALAGKQQFLNEALIGVPIALLVLGTYATQVETDVRVLNVARQHCEQMLEEALDEEALVYQSRFARYRRRGYIWGIEGTGLVLAALAAVAAVVGGFQAEEKGITVLIVYIVVIWLLTACFAVAQVEKTTTQEAARGELPKGSAEG